MEMNLRRSSLKTTKEGSKSGGKCNAEKCAGNDACQPGCLFNARLIVSNGEIAEKQLYMFRHPKTGRATMYAVGSKGVEELLKFDGSIRSNLLGEHVIRNGTFTLLVPIDPILLVLPYLRKYAKDDYAPLENILVDDVFPAVRLLENNETLRSSLKHACYCKNDVSDIEMYKYSEPLFVDYIIDKIIKLMEKAGRHKLSFDYAACAILEANLSADMLELVKAGVLRKGNRNLPGIIDYLKQYSRADNYESNTAGRVLTTVQASDIRTDEVPLKRRRLLCRKTSI